MVSRLPVDADPRRKPPLVSFDDYLLQSDTLGLRSYIGATPDAGDHEMNRRRDR